MSWNLHCTLVKPLTGQRHTRKTVAAWESGVQDTMERVKDRGTQATFWKKPGLPGGFTIVVGMAGGDNDTAESSLHL